MLSESQVSLLSFLGLSAAFHATDFSNLLSQLQQSSGVFGKCSVLVQFFPADQIQPVCVIGCKVLSPIIRCGTSQRSVLGPIGVGCCTATSLRKFFTILVHITVLKTDGSCQMFCLESASLPVSRCSQDSDKRCVLASFGPLLPCLCLLLCTRHPEAPREV